MTPKQSSRDIKREYWGKHNENWLASGLSQQKYCDKENINLTTFTWWRSKGLKDKAGKIISYYKNKEDRYGILKHAIESYKFYNDELRRRMKYINNPIKENTYKFNDFKWLGNMAGFGILTDIYYGSILLGTIESQKDGYVVKSIQGRSGDAAHPGPRPVPLRARSCSQGAGRYWFTGCVRGA